MVPFLSLATQSLLVGPPLVITVADNDEYNNTQDHQQ